MRGMRPFGSVLALWLASCARTPPPQSPLSAHAVRGVLISTYEIDAEPFVVEQRIHGTYLHAETSMDCVVQFSDAKLTVLGLTPFGTRAFSIEQKGTDVHFEKFVERDLPVEPEAVLYDIHRVFFRHLDPGEPDGQDHGELVHERWEDGHIVERRFESLEGPYNNLIVVTYEGPPAPIVAPRVRITNAAFAYSLEIENLEQRTLAGSYTLEVETTKPAEGAEPSTTPAP